MLFSKPLETQNPLREAITQAYHRDETECVEQLLKEATLPADMLGRIADRARDLVNEVRKRRLNKGGLDAFLYEYDLSSSEGIALMCLSEALLRIPDNETIDNLLRDKIIAANWAAHLGRSESFLVNAATWGLLLTGKVLQTKKEPEITGGNKEGLQGSLKRFIERTSLPVIRQAVKHAMKLLGSQFVMGETIDEALKRARSFEKQGYRFSYDMLGEAARTAQDAERYFKSYQHAVAQIGKAAANKGVIDSPGISVKLSALHPRYEFAKHEMVLAEVMPRLLQLAIQAKSFNIGLTVDAEEADRLELSLDIIEKVFCDPALDGWEGFGLAVQSYQKRAPYVIDWLIDLARKKRKRFMLRLIKGAYWDSEIKNAQVKGLSGYPVFTRKDSTDVSFLACARKIINAPDAFYAQFATHNAYSLAAVLEMAQGRRDFEFQCLHGMGYTLYDQVVGPEHLNFPCRVYAPVGGHEDLLAYLVRRLLENGANTSFVNRIVNAQMPVEEIIADPVAKVRLLNFKPHPQIPLPINIYGAERKNSEGIDLTDLDELTALESAMNIAAEQTRSVGSIINGEQHHTEKNEKREVLDPADRRHVIGEAVRATVEQTDSALEIADKAFVGWDLQSVEERAACLDRAADLFNLHMPELMAILVREGGKTIPDAVSEVRETIDYCRYYAARARSDLTPHTLPGPTGETNQLQLRGRGIIACISPWNFPLAIFTGQVTAALVAGNTVIAKPAEQTPVIAAMAVRLLHEAGIPKNVLQLLVGRGSVVGARLVEDPRVSGIVFTGSTETANGINRTLANRSGPIPLLIAETGGQNAMIVDSSALPEQVVFDVVSSSFYSAGQRCSALRVLFLQDDIADKLIEMLCGAMAELRMGDPGLLTTDIGPVIDQGAKATLEEHVKKMREQAKLLYQVSLPDDCAHGSFFGPCAFEIKSLEQLPREVFGPVLHMIRYAARDLDNVIAAINNTGYGLTFGIQSRVEATIEYVRKRIRAGNTYVNRNMIGAVVGVQPFGGEGLSGTGPKAGGPHYLPRFCVERTLCINTTAAGGNASLLCLQE